MDRSWLAGRCVPCSSRSGGGVYRKLVSWACSSGATERSWLGPGLCHECPFARPCPTATRYHRLLHYTPNPAQPFCSLPDPLHLADLLHLTHALLRASVGTGARSWPSLKVSLLAQCLCDVKFCAHFPPPTRTLDTFGSRAVSFSRTQFGFYRRWEESVDRASVDFGLATD